MVILGFILLLVLGIVAHGLHLSDEGRSGTSPGIDPYMWTVEVQQSN